MKIGDQVSHKNLDLRGVITSVNGSIVVIKDEHGFTHKLDKTDLVPDASSLFESLKVNDTKKEDQKTRHKSKKDYSTLDLHFDKLVEVPEFYDASERLHIQKTALLERIEFCKKNKISPLHIIHGLGQGVLQEMVIETLESKAFLEYRHTEVLKEQSASVIVYFR